MRWLYNLLRARIWQQRIKKWQRQIPEYSRFSKFSLAIWREDGKDSLTGRAVPRGDVIHSVQELVICCEERGNRLSQHDLEKYEDWLTKVERSRFAKFAREARLLVARSDAERIRIFVALCREEQSADEMLFEKIRKRDIDAIKKILDKDHSLVHCRECYNFDTPLHTAAHSQQKLVSELLLKKGAKINAKNSYGATPLHEAVDTKFIQDRDESISLIELLLTEGARVDARRRNGMTPLYCAARSNRADAASVLIAHGADVNAKTFDDAIVPGDTPLGAASVNSSISDVYYLIRKHGGVGERRPSTIDVM